MVRRVVRRIAAGGVARTVVVTGHDAAAVVAALDGLDVERVHNEHHRAGMASSLVRGVATLADHAAVLICLADMPDVSSAHVACLLAAQRALDDELRDRAIIVPLAHGRRGNPVLIGRAFFERLLALEGDVGARELIRAHPAAVREVVIDDDAVLTDHDTLEELAALDGR